MEVGTHFELWELLTAGAAVLGSFLTVMGIVVKMLVDQFKEHVDQKFEAQKNASAEAFQKLERARAEAARHWDVEFKKLDTVTRDLEKDFLEWKAELPLQYVRREDYVRGQTVIESKIDAVMSKIELLQIQGAKNG